jgi:hypothetical protein
MVSMPAAVCAALVRTRLIVGLQVGSRYQRASFREEESFA